MSLLKARVLVEKSYDKVDTLELMDKCFDEFKIGLREYLKDIIYDNEIVINDVEKMIKEYVGFGFNYLKHTSVTLEPLQLARDRMTYMNSMLAEILISVDIPYFHAEEGYSIVDYCTNKVLEDGDEIDFTLVIEEFRDAKKRVDALEVEVPTVEGE